MCTAATYKTKDFYFGRNLDLEFSYHETVTVTPRNKVNSVMPISLIIIMP
ncbi:linear amide C-N hydrolase [Sharpea azabuensis]|nr:linear amide C-N hydrolase [Sharpea azabuensis]